MIRFLLLLFLPVIFQTVVQAETKFKDVELVSLDGKKQTLASLAHNDLIVLVAFGSECPILRKHIPQLNALHEKFEGEKVKMIMVNTIKTQSKEILQEEIKNYALNAEIYQDSDPSLLKQLKFSTFSEAVLLNLSKNKVLYQGSINNQFTFDLSRPQPTKNFLADAVNSALAGKKIKIKSDDPFGCSITY